MSAVTPFLKWAGGKRWFVEHWPHIIPGHFKRYVEPFLGSGALFFQLSPNNALLGDANADLIETYISIKDDWKRVHNWLLFHHRNHSKSHYYRVRTKPSKDRFERAARFIYLNRTCWNGLYRVNREGQFNVPIGTKKNVILLSDDFERVAMVLQNVDLYIGDFEKLIDKARDGDLVYADPPYTLRHEHNGFIKYNETLFAWHDQVRLRDALVRAKRRGVAVLATNAFHPSVAELYSEEFQLKRVSRRSVIAADSNARKLCKEFVITSW